MIALAFLACAATTAAQAQESGEDAENDTSLGLTYERKIGRFGTGLIVEFTDSESRETVLALPFFWHPVEPWRTVVAVA